MQSTSTKVTGLLGALLCCSLAACNQPTAGVQSQPMELHGRWLDMALVAPDSRTAARLGVPPVVVGAIVAEVTGGTGSRAARAGIQAGDVIVSVNATPVANLSDLYTLSTKLPVTGAVALDISRRGQPMRAMLPAAMLGPQVAGLAGPMQPPAAPTTGMPMNAQAGMCAPGSQMPGCVPTPAAPMPMPQPAMGGFGGVR